jgi:hypothetical protein
MIATFTTHGDGTWAVDNFPAELIVTREFLRHAHRSFVRPAGFRMVHIVCANACATYRLEARVRAWHGGPTRDFRCRRIVTWDPRTLAVA